MSFLSSGPSYTKLKTNLRLCVNRLKLLEKKKTEIALKARKEIADYIQAGKDDRGRIRVEHIIREDYLVEAMELVEMYCDLLLARFGIIQTMKEIDPGLEEAIATLIWVTPRLQSDVPEFKIVSDQFTNKYGKVFVEACRGDTLRNVSEKVKNKLDVRAPPAMLVERYMMEIAKAYNVPFEPDPKVFREMDETVEGNLLDFGDDPNSRGPPGDGPSFGGGSGGGGGFGGKSFDPDSFHPIPGGQGGASNMPYPPSSSFPSAPSDSSNIGVGGFVMPPAPPGMFDSGPQPFMMPPHQGPPGHSAPPGFHDGPISLPPPYEPRAPETKSQPMPPPGQNPNYSAPPGQNPNYSAPPAPGPNTSAGMASLGLPDLPDVPVSPGHSAAPSEHDDSGTSDFDDLSKRFEELKKRK